MLVTQDRLHELFNYNPSTGEFTRKIRRKGSVLGGRVGNPHCRGYIEMCVDYKKYLAHRLVWLYVHGVPPAGEIDHINGDRSDNRISNLRDVPPAMNQQNQRSAHRNNKSSGLLGVSIFSGKSAKKWRADIHIGGKQIYLGCFETPGEAHAAYLSAKRERHEGCTI